MRLFLLSLMVCSIPLFGTSLFGRPSRARAQRFEAVPISGASENMFFWTLDNYGAVAGWERQSSGTEAAVYALPGASVTRADFAGRGYSMIVSLSNRGYGVGRSQFDDGPRESTPSRAAVFLPDRVFDLGTLPGDLMSQAWDANETGTVVGASLPARGTSQSRAFVWESGAMRTLPTPAGMFSVAANVVNNTGLIGGYADGRPYVWLQSTYALDLSRYLPAAREGYRRELCYVQDLNDAWQIAVQCVEARGDGLWRRTREVAFLGSRGAFVEVAPGYEEVHVDAINAQGCIVGEARHTTADTFARPFLTCGSAYTTLFEVSTPSGRIASVSDINDRGEILGVSESGAPYILRPLP